MVVPFNPVGSHFFVGVRNFRCGIKYHYYSYGVLHFCGCLYRLCCYFIQGDNKIGTQN